MTSCYEGFILVYSCVLGDVCQPGYSKLYLGNQRNQRQETYSRINIRSLGFFGEGPALT